MLAACAVSPEDSVPSVAGDAERALREDRDVGQCGSTSKGKEVGSETEATWAHAPTHTAT